MTDNSPEPRADGQPPKAERGGLWGLFLGLAGLLFPPYTGVLSVFGFVQGFRARRAARVNSTTAPGAILSVGLGAVGIVVSTAMVGIFFVYQEQVTDYRDCSARANTVSTQNECDSAWESHTGLPPLVLGV